MCLVGVYQGRAAKIISEGIPYLKETKKQKIFQQKIWLFF